MNRTNYFNYIEEKLNTLSTRIIARGQLNILDLNIHSETFFADLLNIVLGLELVNMNIVHQNIEGIDLVDSINKTMAQVTSTCTKAKLENTLSKQIFLEYSDYRFIFVSIAREATELKGKKFNNPHNVMFTPETDIIDNIMILRFILDKPIEEQKTIYELVKNELGQEINLLKVNTNLATIINILAKENLVETIESPEINHFEIEKKIDFNDLSSVSGTINDYKVYYKTLNDKYETFDKEGSNKSFSVLQSIKTQYLKRQNDGSAQEVFYAIIDDIIEIIINSKNYIEIPYEELELCVNILVVDAFIRCKIFKNPEGYNHVIT